MVYEFLEFAIYTGCTIAVNYRFLPRHNEHDCCGGIFSEPHVDNYLLALNACKPLTWEFCAFSRDDSRRFGM